MSKLVVIGANSFTIDREDAKKILSTFAWSVASAGVAGLLAVLPLVHYTGVSPTVAFAIASAVPLVNTALVALQRWVNDKRLNP